MFGAVILEGSEETEATAFTRSHGDERAWAEIVRRAAEGGTRRGRAMGVNRT